MGEMGPAGDGRALGIDDEQARTDYFAQCSCFGPLVDSWSGGGPVWGMVRNIVLLAFSLWPGVLILREMKIACPNGVDEQSDTSKE